MGAISPFPTVETCLTWIKACVSNRKITQICLYFLLFSFIENGFLSHIIYPDYSFPFLYSYQFFHIFFPNRTTPFLCLIRKKTNLRNTHILVLIAQILWNYKNTHCLGVYKRKWISTLFLTWFIFSHSCLYHYAPEISVPVETGMHKV